MIDNDPSAGSPTETLLRLLLPLENIDYTSFQIKLEVQLSRHKPVLSFLEIIQSVVATGGVYKGQGRNQRELMTRTY
jgi:hypothetical protein